MVAVLLAVFTVPAGAAVSLLQSRAAVSLVQDVGLWAPGRACTASDVGGGLLVQSPVVVLEVVVGWSGWVEGGRGWREGRRRGGGIGWG